MDRPPLYIVGWICFQMQIHSWTMFIGQRVLWPSDTNTKTNLFPSPSLFWNTPNQCTKTILKLSLNLMIVFVL